MSRQATKIQTRSGWATRMAGVLALSIAAIALTAASASAAVPRSFWGVVPQTPLETVDYDRMGQGNVGTLRVPLLWANVDPGPAAGDTSFASFDPIVAGAARNGIEVLPFLYGTPTWAAQQLDGRSCSPEKCGISAPASDAALQGWATFTAEAVDRYGPNGSFWTENPALPKIPITDWQIWNEQNSKTFYAPKASPKNYAKLLAASAGAIRSRDPSANVVLGGMAELAGSKKAIPASDYLKQFYKVRGVEANFDGVAIHPYGSTTEKVIAQLLLFRSEMKDARDSGAGLWITEIGWGSASGGNPLNRGSKGQADRLKETFKYFRKKANKLNIESVQWFSWMDSATSICDWCSKSGLFAAGLAEKPAWRAFTKFTGGS
jgi:hypothetical protein